MQRMPQDSESTDVWPQSMTPDALAGVGEDDLTKFLELDPDFNQYQQLDADHGRTALDTPMGRLAFGSSAMAQQRSVQGATTMQTMDMSMLGTPQMAPTYADMQSTMSQQHQHNETQQQQQQYQHYHMYQQMDPTHHYRIPPTPVSAEMHAAKYAAQVENANRMMFDHNQASFTPLVSPAQTPLDNAFCMPEFVMGDDFFSPLTSPAIEAQPPFSSTNATASPIDLNSDGTNGTQLAASTSRKGRRKGAQPTQRSSVRSVRQSPAMKPQPRRRQGSLHSLPIAKLQTMLDSHVSDPLLPMSARAATFASSEDSVSPEPLSEALMRPPPLPSNHIRSPVHALRPHVQDDNMPATPAMIMRMPGNQSSQGQAGAPTSNDEIMEDIALPDAINMSQPQSLPNSGELVRSPDDQSTPTIAAKTPKLSADSTPRSSAMKSGNNSNDSVDKLKRFETSRTGVRANKKRQSTSSATISPALRPKISPSISPLVPATAVGIPGLSAETSALYLASKSNYQNILDGTHLPGVSYPETLAENLSSKRTSHKIAEQGRRNRINLALKEIESLLPTSITGIPTPGTSSKSRSSISGSKDNGCKEMDEASPEKPSNINQGASKANTVEMAIVYIKSLQAELRDTKMKLEAAEKMIATGHVSAVAEVAETATATTPQTIDKDRTIEMKAETETAAAVAVAAGGEELGNGSSTETGTETD